MWLVVAANTSDATELIGNISSPWYQATQLIAGEGHTLPSNVRFQELPSHYSKLIDTVAIEYQLDAKLLHAIIHTESAYNAAAISRAGAVGLMQVMPQTGRRFGFSALSDPVVNVRAGATYLKWLLGQFGNNLELAVAAYNAGEGAIYKYHYQVPPYPETQDYVFKVMARYRKPKGELTAASFSQPKTAANRPLPQLSIFSVARRLAGVLVSAPSSSLR